MWDSAEIGFTAYFFKKEKLWTLMPTTIICGHREFHEPEVATSASASTDDTFFDDAPAVLSGTGKKAKYCTFSATYRPAGGVTDAEIDIIRKKLRGAKHYLITEKTGEARHCHWCWETKVPKVTANAKAPFYIALKEQASPETKMSVAFKVRIWYNLDFLQEYMEKPDDHVTISQDLPSPLVFNFPPPDDKRAVREFEDPWFTTQMNLFLADHEADVKRYLETKQYGSFHVRDAATVGLTLKETVAYWLTQRMYSRAISVIHDPRVLKNKVKALHHCIFRHLFGDDKNAMWALTCATNRGIYPYYYWPHWRPTEFEKPR